MLLAALSLALVSADLDAVLDNPALEGAIVGACVMDRQGNVLYQRNADMRLIPASNQKLLTCLYALEKLGPAYTPKTSFWRQPGRIVVDSPGDPMLTLDELLRARKALNISEPMPVYVRQAYDVGWPPSWEIDDLPHRYAPAITAFAYDRAGMELWAEGGDVVPPRAELGIEIERGETTGPVRVESRPWLGKIIVHGALPQERTRIETLAQPNPDVAAARVLAGELRPATSAMFAAPPDWTITGEPVSAIIKACLEDSDNYLAESLLLKSAATESNLQNQPYEAARASLKKFLVEAVGIDKNAVRPFDGSGLSRHSVVTPRALATVLTWALNRPYVGLWKQALAAPGEGTLKNRLDGVPFIGKTGSVDMVSALSGYVTLRDGRTVSVTLIMNHFLVPVSQVRAIQDQFMIGVSQTSFNGTELVTELGSEAHYPNPLARSANGDSFLGLVADGTFAR